MKLKLPTEHSSISKIAAIFKFVILFAFLVNLSSLNAQVSTYTLTQNVYPTGSILDPLTAPTVWINAPAAANDDAILPVTFGGTPAMAFKFNGTAYTGMYISTNGFVYFDTAPLVSTATTSTVYSPIASTLTYDGAIAVFGLNWNYPNAGAATQVRYSLEGTYPNRKMIVEWVARKKVSTNTDTGIHSFQLQLFEDGHATEPNSIVMKYNERTTTSPQYTQNSTAQIGLRGPNTSATEVLQLTLPTNSLPYPGTFTTTSNSALTVTARAANTILASSARELIWRPSTCFVPTSLVVSNITSNGATFSWVAPSPTPAEYDYEIRTANAAGSGPAGLAANGTTLTNSFSENTLAADTNYFIYVRSSCGGPFSIWTAGVPFTTQCAPVSLPYAEYFDPFAAPGFTVPNIPDCTTVTQNGLGNVWVTEGPDFSADFFDEHLVYNASITQDANTWFYTKGLNLTAGVTYRISYVYGGAVGPTLVNKMKVAFGSYAEAAAMTTVIMNDNNIKTTPLEFVTNFTVPSNGVYYFGFQAYSALNQAKLYLDNIDIIVEDCKAPTGIIIPAGTITPSSAQVFFTAPAPVPGDGYQYYLSIDPTPPVYGTSPTGVVSAGATSFTLSPLPQLTTFYLWIRSNCGSKYSLWSPMANFTTTGVPVPTPINMTASTYSGPGCNVTFFDSGGSGGNYSNSENKTYTFAAAAGTQIQAIFNSFQTENNWDGLMIYDGPNTGSPVIPSGLPAGFGTAAPANSFYGTTSPGTIYSTSGYLTFKFTSDTSVLSGGWSASLRCVQAPTITSFSPTTNGCATGITVTVNGTNFGPTATVFFNGIAAVTTYVSSVKLTAILPANATTGIISVTSGSPAATGNSTGIFTVNAPGPETTGVSVCAGSPATQFLTTSAACEGYTVASPRNKLPVSLTTADPYANRQPIVTNSTFCQFSTFLRRYTMTTFQVSANGTYTFTAVSGVDSMGYITLESFTTPGVCNPGFIIGDDDSGPGLEAEITVALTAGVTYKLWSTTWLDVSMPLSFNWNITPPTGADILTDGEGIMQWWTAATGGIKVHEGVTYNPVGDADSGIVDMNTPGIFKFYAICSSNTVCRTETIYEIKPLPNLAMSGAGTSVCSGVVVPITATGTATSFLWSSSEAGTLFSDAAGTVAYDGVSSLTTIYLKSATTATVTLVGTDSVTGCSKTITGVYSVNTKTWNGVNAWIPAGAPTMTDALVFNTGTYAALTDLNGCSCTISGGAQVTIKSGYTLKLENGLNVAAAPSSLVFENNASLVQVNDAAVNVGPITYIRNTTPMALYDYTYWSTPVSPQSLFGLSQYTLADKFFVYNQLADTYTNVPSSTIMDVGRGYLVRAPQPNLPAPFPIGWAPGNPFIAKFQGSTGVNGVPNNGVYSVPIYNTGSGPGTNDGLNLIGNPYPSAVNIDLFLDSSAGKPNAGKLEGIIYLWTHNTPITGNVYQYSDYAIYTYLGGVGTRAGGGSGNTNVPDGEIAAGQAFYVKVSSSGPISTTTPQSVIFNNSMRVSGDNDQFFRLSAAEKNRVWLELKNDQGAYKQMLVGYVAGATNGYDSQFDGEILEAGNVVSLYSIGRSEKFAIQGRAMPFENSDLVPMGYRTSVAGNFEIALSNYDGLFNNQDIFLEDKLLNVIHNLKNSNYVFATAVGTFEERFVLRYTDSSLGIDGSIHNENAALVYKDNQVLHVVSGNAMMEEVKIFDVRGRLLAVKRNLNTAAVTFDNLEIAQEVLLVQITLNDGTVISKKTVF